MAKARKIARGKKSAPKKKVAAVPPGYFDVTPYIVCRNASDAIEFYKKAFGAKERRRMAGPDGKIMHAEISIGKSIVMLGDESPEMGVTSPQTINGTASGLFLYLPDVDQAFARAVAAGARPEMPPSDMFWGDRYAKLADPFGHKWSMATHIEDMSPKEMQRRGEQFMRGQK